MRPPRAGGGRGRRRRSPLRFCAARCTLLARESTATRVVAVVGLRVEVVIQIVVVVVVVVLVTQPWERLCIRVDLAAERAREGGR